MINVDINLGNSLSDRQGSIKSVSGRTPFKHKVWEFQLNRVPDIIGIDFQFTTQQNHAGLYLGLSLIGFEVVFHVYDQRHWDDEKKCWVASE